MLGLVDQREFAHMQSSEVLWANPAPMTVPTMIEQPPQPGAAPVGVRASLEAPIPTSTPATHAATATATATATAAATVATTSVTPTPTPNPPRPLAPRRQMTVPRPTPPAREKPYTRRKSNSANTFTNAHELALWESKMRNPGAAQNGAGFRANVGPAVQMTPIPMVQDYLLPSAKLQQLQQHSKGHGLGQGQQAHGLAQGHAQQHGHQTQVLAQGLSQGLAQGQGLALPVSLVSESKSTPPSLSPSQSPHSAHPALAAQPPTAGLGSAACVPTVSHSHFVQQSPSIMVAGASAAATASPSSSSAAMGPPAAAPLSMANVGAQQQEQGHVTPQAQLAGLPEAGLPVSVMHTPMYAYQPMDAAGWTSPEHSVALHPAAQWTTTLQQQYPQDVASVYTAPIFPAQSPTSAVVGTPSIANGPQSPSSIAPLKPHGPYPSGQCTWYYYDPDNSPMPPPPVPVPAPSTSASTATGAARTAIDTGAGTSDRTAATTTQNPNNVPTTEHPDPFPGALADAKGWYLLDLKTNLPFHVPFDPIDAPAPEPGVQLAAPLTLRRKTGKISPAPAVAAASKAQSQSPQASVPGQQQQQQILTHTRSTSLPTISYQPLVVPGDPSGTTNANPRAVGHGSSSTDSNASTIPNSANTNTSGHVATNPNPSPNPTSNANNANNANTNADSNSNPIHDSNSTNNNNGSYPEHGAVTSPVTPPTPGSLSTAGAASDTDAAMNFPIVSPALYYTNPAHMSSLFKRRRARARSDS